MKVSQDYSRYYRYDELTDILKGYAERYPRMARLESAGRTDGGRDIWVLSLTDTSSGAHESKPAYFVNANIHAGELTGCMCAMFFLDYLVTNAASREVAALLGRFTFYFMPRISPDGAECYLTTPTVPRSVDKLYPYEQSLEGLQPKDMDGDGVIRKMRVKSPYGIWKQSPRDPRLMSRRKPDDVEGVFYNIFSEGEIAGFDGRAVTAKANSGYDFSRDFCNDFNRNFPLAWTPEHHQRGAGVYPLCHPETRAVAEFVNAHRNIGSAINFHTMTGLYLHPPGSKHPREAFADDMRRYCEIGEIITEETGFPLVNTRRDFFIHDDSNPSTGSMEDFLHFCMGIFNYTVECWDFNPRAGVPIEFPQTDPVTEREKEDRCYKYMKWVDENLDGEGYMPWTRFSHPQLGEVEIGGIDYKRVIQNTPIKFLRGEMEKHSRFMLRHLKMMPDIRFGAVRAERADTETWRVEAFVMNTGYMPTYITREAVKLATARDLRVSLSGEGVEFICGRAEERIGHLEGFSGVFGDQAYTGPITDISDECPVERKISWIIKAKPGTKLSLACYGEKAGRAEAELVLS